MDKPAKSIADPMPPRPIPKNPHKKAHKKQIPKVYVSLASPLPSQQTQQFPQPQPAAITPNTTPANPIIQEQKIPPSIPSTQPIISPQVNPQITPTSSGRQIHQLHQKHFTPKKTFQPKHAHAKSSLPEPPQRYSEEKLKQPHSNANKEHQQKQIRHQKHETKQLQQQLDFYKPTTARVDSLVLELMEEERNTNREKKLTTDDLEELIGEVPDVMHDFVPETTTTTAPPG